MGVSTILNYYFVFNFRAVFKYNDKTIVHEASGTDYQEFLSHFGGWYIPQAVFELAVAFKTPK